MRISIAILAVLTLAGCGEAEQNADEQAVDLTPSAAIIKQADNLIPASAELASIYDRSCRSCHSVEGLEAPLTGHTEAWKARLDERGADGLLKSTKSGYKAMPAMGQCNDCSDEQLQELINFMSAGA